MGGRGSLRKLGRDGGRQRRGLASEAGPSVAGRDPANGDGSGESRRWVLNRHWRQASAAGFERQDKFRRGMDFVIVCLAERGAKGL
jgi:hypothetical protein